MSLAAVLLGTAPQRLSLREFVTFLDTSGRLDGRYEPDLASELRHRHSNRPRRRPSCWTCCYPRWTYRSRCSIWRLWMEWKVEPLSE